MMWGHYAENGTDFTLDCDFRNGNLKRDGNYFVQTTVLIFSEAHSFVKKNRVVIYLERKINSINEKILKDIAKKRLDAIK